MIELCSLNDIPDPGSIRVDKDGLRLVVVRIGDDVWAMNDRCTHAEASLAEGELWIEEREIECPRHGSTFDLDNGVPQSLPATQPAATYQVVVINGLVNIVVPG
ncbi:MAG: non-heme iron oxygenase ferredoxin subunit [Actinobacteria bacterium]|nr:non-heme iron oxygenase ferredoxin subunit [Actinomycetota bacterium]MCB9390575.1 non-heme iron oxygenase ferredoxin subunit [Acidimicrobiia bacterium]